MGNEKGGESVSPRLDAPTAGCVGGLVTSRYNDEPVDEPDVELERSEDEPPGFIPRLRASSCGSF